MSKDQLWQAFIVAEEVVMVAAPRARGRGRGPPPIAKGTSELKVLACGRGTGRDPGRGRGPRRGWHF